MADYSELLDDEIQAYLADCDRLYPPDAVEMSIEDQRRHYDDLAAYFDRGRPADVTVTDEAQGGVPCRRYEPPEPPHATVLYVHGGGFVVGGLDSHDSICAEICGNTGLRVVSVDYPLAPEHRYPEDFDAVWTAYRAVREAWEGPVILSGDSAGGTLCASVAHKGRDEGQPADGQVLIYPSLGGDTDLPSYVTHANAPQLTRRDIEYYRELRPGGPPPQGDAYFQALKDDDYTNLPPTLCVTAHCDPLTSDSEIYCQRITAAGGRAHWIDEAGLVHGYLRARGVSERAATSFSRICRGIGGLASGAWPPV